ncbi:unnamed protein product [Hyaloperonospora brassicae]|uniref:PH domain-containing protein n=1 Tax=Hyaloperonospora brassicae TaxID=162125 RepID=A0AAV0TWF5_HYABA|nr:unnamed protein product [Hyaloperonospora brassicae]
MASRQKAPTAASRSVRDSSGWRPSRCSYSSRSPAFDAEVPAMMEPQSDHSDFLARSSLLSFRGSRVVRMSPQPLLHHHPHLLPAHVQHHQHPSGRKHPLLRATGGKGDGAGNKSEWDDSSSDTTSSSDKSESPTANWSHCTSRVTFQLPSARRAQPISTNSSNNNNSNNNNNSSSNNSEDDEADDAQEVGDKVDGTSVDRSSRRHDRVESVLAVMSAVPVSGPIPLLEQCDSDDDDNDIDTIICDPSRLPGTLVVDENGLTVSRESGLVRAANVPRGSVIKAGLLFKQGFGLRSGGWKVRYVVLTSTKMTFYREERGRKRGEIDLAKCSAKSVEIMPRDSVFDGSQASMWRFAIRGKVRRVLLSAYSESEMKEWLRCLHVALAVQAAGVGRYTDLVVPSGTFLAERSAGLMRSSGVS